MKKNFLKKVLALSTAAILAVGTLAGCGGGGGDAKNDQQSGGTQQGGADNNSGGAGADNSGDAKGGKILFLSNLTSGAQYDFFVAFYENACKDLGYSFEGV